MKRFFDISNVLLLVLMAGFAVWASTRLPEQIPLQFGLKGEVGRWGEKTFLSWFGLPGIAVGLTLAMGWLRRVLPRHPRWVGLPNRQRLSDFPEAARGPVVEMMSGFFSLIQTKLLVIFGLIEWASYRTALGLNSQALMILVAALACTPAWA